MVDYQTLSKFHAAGIQTDCFGRPIKVGDTILCKGYGSMDKDCFAKVLKVNRKSIGINLTVSRYIHGTFQERPANHTGYWNYYPNRKRVTETKYMTRVGMDVMIVPEDFQQTCISEGQAFIDQYPELLI